MSVYVVLLKHTLVGSLTILLVDIIVVGNKSLLLMDKCRLRIVVSDSHGILQCHAFFTCRLQKVSCTLQINYNNWFNEGELQLQTLCTGFNITSKKYMFWLPSSLHVVTCHFQGRYSRRQHEILYMLIFLKYFTIDHGRTLNIPQQATKTSRVT